MTNPVFVCSFEGRSVTREKKSKNNLGYERQRQHRGQKDEEREKEDLIFISVAV